MAANPETLAAAAAVLGAFRDQHILRRPIGSTEDPDGRNSGKIAKGLSMSGQRRLDHAAAVAAAVVEEGIAGHFLETGVFRGGISFLVAKTFELLGERASDRRVYLADSFAGLPDFRTYTPHVRGYNRAWFPRTLRLLLSSASTAQGTLTIRSALVCARARVLQVRGNTSEALQLHRLDAQERNARTASNPHPTPPYRLCGTTHLGSQELSAHRIKMLNHNSLSRVQASAKHSIP
jgi:hypothetical protein